MDGDRRMCARTIALIQSPRGGSAAHISALTLDYIYNIDTCVCLFQRNARKSIKLNTNKSGLSSMIDEH